MIAAAFQMLKTSCLLGLLSGVGYACSMAIGEAEDDQAGASFAFLIYGLGFLPLIAHVWVTTYRKWTKRHISRLVVWSTIGLSALVIPVIFMMIMMDSGMGCGTYSVQYASYLLLFETFALLAQIVAWRIPPRKDQITILDTDARLDG